MSMSKKTIDQVNAELADISEEMAEKWEDLMGLNAPIRPDSPTDVMMGWLRSAVTRVGDLLAQKTELDLLRLKGASLDEIASHLGWSEATKEHARGSIEDVYENEGVIVTHSGRELRFPAYPLPCDYLRIVEYGFELAYWNSDEWRDAPDEVIGAIMGCSMNGQGAPESVNLAETAILEYRPRQEEME